MENMNKEKGGHEEIVIHVDKKQYHSPNPTTGAALYLLTTIDPNKYDLYREIHGNEDDEVIYNNNSELILKNGDHFYSVQKNINPGT